MAHGNASDMVFFALLLGAIQTWLAPGLLFQSDFPLADPHVGAMIKLSGGLALLVGLTLSGVKWNPINGKGAGFAGFCAVANAVTIGLRTGHIFFFVFAAVLLAGAIHICFFPSNPPVAKVDPATKNNHGNASDLVAVLLLVGSLLCIFYPSPFFQAMGPIQSSFTEVQHPEELNTLISYCGGWLLTISMMLSGVKWNPINGKMAGIGYFVCTGICVCVGSGSFFYLMGLVLLLGGVHVCFFPSNPLPPKAKK